VVKGRRGFSSKRLWSLMGKTAGSVGATAVKGT